MASSLKFEKNKKNLFSLPILFMGINRSTKHGDSLFNLIFISFFVVIITNKFKTFINKKLLIKKHKSYRVERN